MIGIHLRRIVFFTGLGVLSSYFYCKVTPKIYLAKAEIIVGEQASSDTNLSTDVQEILMRGAARDLRTEQRVLLSQAVYLDALEVVSKKLSQPKLLEDFKTLHEMYDVISEKKTSGTQEQASVLEIAVKTYDEETSVLLADEIINVYNQLRRKLARSAVDDAISYLGTQIQKTGVDLKAIDEKYQKYKEQAQIADIGLKASQVTQTRSMLEQTVQQIESQVASVDAEVSTLKKKIKEIPKFSAESNIKTINPIIQMVESQIADNKRRRQELLTTYLEDSVPVKTVDRTIETLEDNLKELKKSEYKLSQKNTRPDPVRMALQQQLYNAQVNHNSLQDKLRVVRGQLALYEAKAARLPVGEVDLAQIERERTIADLQFKRLKTQLEELENRTATTPRSALILSPAMAEDEAVAPQTTRMLVFGGFAGAFLGLIISTLLEAIRMRIYNSEQLGKLTGLPVLASSPPVSKKYVSKVLVALQNRGIRPLESYRFMANALTPTHYRGRPQTILLTSPRVSTGSVYAATHLAAAYVTEGKKVILVDIDPQKKMLTQLAKLQDKQGLCEWIFAGSFDADLSRFLTSTKWPDLFILPFGKVQSAYITATEMGQLVHSLRRHADYVIFVTSPCNLSTPASVLAKSVDFVCVAASAQYDSAKDVMTACAITMAPELNRNVLVLTEVKDRTEPFGTIQSTDLIKQEPSVQS